MTVQISEDLVKCSERSIRKPCKFCGRREGLYWAHDLSKPGNKYCAKCQGPRSFVLIEADGTRHACRDGAHDQGPDDDAVKPVEGVPFPARGTDLPERPAPAPSAGFAGVTNEAAQLAELIGKMARGTVDESQVRAMISDQLGTFSADMIETVGALVSDRLAKITVPTVVEVRKPDGEAKTVKGAHKALPKILAALNIGQHVLMVGPMGTGKSTIAAHAAEALEVPFAFMAVGPQTSKSDILGYMTADGTYVPSLFRKAYESGGVFLFDELDAAHPGVLTIINAALANGHMAFPDGMVTRHESTRIVAAANTYGRGPDRMYVGRQAIDAATLDRFCVVDVEVDAALEDAMCYGTGLDAVKVDQVLSYVRKLRANAERHKMAVGFSPRASHGVCALVAAGWSVKDAIESRVRRGLSDQDWSKVTADAVTPRA